MPRWKPDAQARLTSAALELFDERGYDDTTVAEIAARAGLTKRTFFRYFSDKREVLFAGSDALRDAFISGIAAAPPGAAPMDAMAAAFVPVGELFADRRPFAMRRQRVIAASPELRERELIKLVTLSQGVAAALSARGVAEPAAALTAEAGMAVFRVAFERWVDEANEQPLDRLLDRSLDELRALTAA